VSPFLPNQIDDLKLWLDAGRGITEISGRVVSWENQVVGGGNFNDNGVAAQRPYLTANVINNNPVVRFDGVGNWLIHSLPATYFNFLHQSASTVFFTHIYDGYGKYGIWFDTRSSSTASPSYAYGTYFANIIDYPFFPSVVGKFIARVWGLDLLGQSNYLFDANQVIGVPFITHTLCSGNLSPNGLQIFENGILKAESTLTGNGTQPAGRPNAVIGTGGDFNGTYLWKGDIAEILMYERKLNSVEISQVLSYLQTKYAL
jgi:hypothetical protein